MLANRDFRLFWAGQGVSLLGSQVTNLALPLAAIAIYGASAEQVGWLRFVELAPYLFLSLPFGVWVDRARRRPVMVAANAARAVLLAAVPLLAHLGWLSVNGLVAIAAVSGVLAVLFDVSWASYLPSLVHDRARLVEANQKLGVTQSTMDLAGPGLAGVLIGAVGSVPALLIDAFSYAVSATSLLLIRAVESAPQKGPRADRSGHSFIQDLREGLRFVFTHPVLRPLAVIAPFTNLSLTAVSTLFLLTAARDLAMTSTRIGLVFSVSAIGALLGAASSQRLLRRYRPGPLYVAALAALYAGPLLIPLARSSRTSALALVVVGLLISYFGSGLSNVIQLSLRQSHTPAVLMGRMSAAFRTLLFGGGAIGGLAAGALAGALGDHTALVVVTTWSALMALPILLSPARRITDSTQPDQREGERA